jgi:cyclic pyranopterin phosphate synthase
VEVELEVADDAIEIRASVKTTGRTGVEMEALTSVAVAGLTLHDMVKAVDPAAVLTEVRVLSKTGGKSGDWLRDQPASQPAVARSPGLPADATARVVTVSDRSAAGTREDRSGPLLASLLREVGFDVDDVAVVPDDAGAVAAAVHDAVRAGRDLVVTTGGTGFAPRDVTPEATRGVIEREAPGLVELLRSVDRERVPTSILSRGAAGIAGRSIVVNLPGSTGGVRDGVAALAPVIGHAIDQVRGGGDHG